MEIQPQKKLLLADRIAESYTEERVEMVFNCFQECVRFGQVAISLQEERSEHYEGGHPKLVEQHWKGQGKSCANWETVKGEEGSGMSF